MFGGREVADHGGRELAIVVLPSTNSGENGKMGAGVFTVLLWLFVIDLGITFGAGLYEARISTREWIGTRAPFRWNAEAARRADVGRRFWVFVTTVPLTLISLASLWAAWATTGPERTWWLAAALAAIVDRVFTFVYFVPTMLKLMREDELGDAQATALALRWANLNYVRLSIVLAAWLMALKALSLR